MRKAVLAFCLAAFASLLSFGGGGMNRRRILAACASRVELPYDYAVEYIELSEFINSTGLVARRGYTDLHIKFCITGNALDGSICGDNWGSNLLHYTANNIINWWGTVSSFTLVEDYVPFDVVSIDIIRNDGIYFNGTFRGSVEFVDRDVAFACPDAQGAGVPRWRIYEFQMKVGDESYTLIPCVKDGVASLYEVERGSFIQRSDFIAGDRVNL